jgi:hypothetical protein
MVIHGCEQLRSGMGRRSHTFCRIAHARSAPWLTLALAAILVTSGCGALPLKLSQSASTLAAPSELPADIEHAIEFRRDVGLRADEAWAREVASRADRDMTYAVPLTPAEATSLRGRVTAAHEVGRVLQAYGNGHPADWGGLYIDQPAGSVVVVQFTGDLDAHRAAIRQLVGPSARWEARLVPYSIAELNALRDQVHAELPWIAEQGLVFNSLGVDERANHVRLVIEVPPGRDGDVVAPHFARDPRLSIEQRPQFVWTKGYGTLTIISRTSDGQPVANLYVELEFAERTDRDRDPGLGTQPNGVTRLELLPATRVTVRLWKLASGERVDVGAGTTVIPNGGEAVVSIIVAD